jgi:catechol 2,3-dioxygenase-like lactoylglutathione lyase family enzyme
MLGDKDAVASIAVRDLARARKFYEETLELRQVAAAGEGLIVFKCGKTTVNVYQSRYAGTNQATTLSWAVDHDIENVVRALKAKGVTFEHYDLPETTREGDIHTGVGIRVAWFKDPDGNILSLTGR